MCGIFAATPLAAQTIIQTPAQVDSLRLLIATTNDDATRINAMNEMANHFATRNLPDSAMMYARAALAMAERSNFRAGIATALNNIGQVVLKQGRNAAALEYHKRSLRINEELGNKEGIATSLRFIGNTYIFLNKFSEALEYLLTSLRMNEELGNKLSIARILSNIGVLYFQVGKYHEALDYFLKSLHIYEDLGNKVATAGVLSSIGISYGNLGNYKEAIEYQLKAIRISEEIGDIYLIAMGLTSVGNSYILQGQYKQAQPFLFQAMRLWYKFSLKMELPNTLNNIAISYHGLGKFDSAMVYALYSLRLADSAHTLRHIKIALEQLSITSDSLGLHKDALAYYKRCTTVKDSLINLENLNKTAELKESYEAEKREQQIALLTKDKALQESEISRRSLIQWSLIGVLVAVAAGTVWLGGLYRQKNAANKAILQQQVLLENQAHEIQQANVELHQQNEELDALNTEKNEIMGIVSHDLKNPIGAVRGYAELIQSGVFEGDEVLGVAEQITQVSERMLELVKNLLDMNLLESGGLQLNILNFDIASLVEAAVQQYRTPAQAKNIKLHFSNEAENSIISADERAMIQVLDNLVSNAVKYSPLGKNVFIRLKTSNDAVRVEVQDEGQGISEEDMKKLFGKFQRLSALPTGGEHSTGLGLSIVKKIVEAMDGRVWCESELGKGATFVVELPTTPHHIMPGAVAES